MSSSARVVQLVREARSAVQHAIARSHLFRAWELLQERDGEGNAKGPLPYTDLAFAELADAYNNDPDDINTVHHLAIAHHARAWDLELKQHPRAMAEWERALAYWRTIAASAEFWSALKKKLLACDKEADPSVLDDVRQNLLEHLLEVHVEFVRHYCETEVPERATDHVELVKRARIPPAVKKRLVDKVYEAMTGMVPEARAAFEFDSALTTVERFLALFPDHLPALRLYVEICRDSVGKMSYQHDWNEILRTAQRAEPHARRLAAHSQIDDAPLAKTALEELAFEIALRCRDRSESLLSASITTDNRDSAKTAFEMGINWVRFGLEHYPSGSDARAALAACLQGHAYCLYLEVSDVMGSSTDLNIRLATAEKLLQDSIAEMEEALSIAPSDDAAVNSVLDKLRSDLATIQQQKALFGLFGDGGLDL